MKTESALLLLALAATVSVASAQGVYMKVPRDNDPFVFCTEGPYKMEAEKIQHCWKPSGNNPQTAIVMYTCWDYCTSGGCPPMNMVSAGQWAAICRIGGGKGSDWMGKMPANMTPNWH